MRRRTFRRRSTRPRRVRTYGRIPFHQMNSLKKRASRLTYRAVRNRIPTAYPIPNVTYLVMPFFEQFRVGNSSSSNFDGRVYRLNALSTPSPYSPHQPRGRDQMSTWYSTYQVFKAVVEVTFMLQTQPGTAQHDVVVNLQAFESNSAAPSLLYNNLLDIMESAGGRVCYAHLNSVTRRSAVLRRTFDIAEILGIGKKQYSTPLENVILAGADPAASLTAWLGICVLTADQSVLDQEIQVNLSINYFTRWGDPVKITAS